MYLAVEVSFTADKRDADRAVRNVEFLRRCTGNEAKAVVASVKNDRHVSQLIKQGLVYWHQIDEDTLKAD